MVMHGLVKWVGIAILVLMARSGIGVAAEEQKASAAVVQGDKEEITLTGEFVWSSDKNQKKHDLRIVATPKPDGEYDAVYSFTWKKQKMNWKGTIKGNLKNGDVSGTGVNDDGKRTFEFTGKAADGIIDCKHTETTGKKQKPTGTMTIKLS